MRMWHYKLIPYLPDNQLKGQLRELIAIMHNWRDKGTPKHMLVNNVIKYPKSDFYSYFEWFKYNYEERLGKEFNRKYIQEFQDFCEIRINSNVVAISCLKNISNIYVDWHNEEYLRVCMANLYEKFRFSYLSKSGISSKEWDLLCKGYKKITGRDYIL